VDAVPAPPPAVVSICLPVKAAFLPAADSAAHVNGGTHLLRLVAVFPDVWPYIDYSPLVLFALLAHLGVQFLPLGSGDVFPATALSPRPGDAFPTPFPAVVSSSPPVGDALFLLQIMTTELFVRCYLVASRARSARSANHCRLASRMAWLPSFCVHATACCCCCCCCLQLSSLS